MKKIVMTVIITVIICITVTVCASNLLASNISYKNGTVKDALDELYNKSDKVHLVKIGDYNSIGSYEVDIKSILPDNYSTLTMDNFVLKDVKERYKNNYTSDAYNYIVNSYDSNRGILNLSTSRSGDGNYDFYIDYSVYCILGDIEIENTNN